MIPDEFVMDDKSVMEDQFHYTCSYCKHYLSGKKCKAFPEIPAEIWEGDNPHTSPYPGDNGIQFELIEGIE